MYINELKKKNVVVKSDNRFIFLFNIIVKLWFDIDRIEKIIYLLTNIYMKLIIIKRLKISLHKWIDKYK